MNKTKAQSSLVATQRAGQALHADFCCWHARLVDAELVASCTLENCPLQHAQTVHGSVKNTAHIVLRRGVTLANLKQAFGEDDWPLFKDHLPALRSALNQLAASRHPTGALSERGAVSHHGLLPHEREPDGPLVEISEFYIHILAPSLAWIGFSERETKAGLNDILSNVGPGSIKQGNLLCEFVFCHSYGFRLFAEEWTKTIIPKHMNNIPSFHESNRRKEKPITPEEMVFTSEEMVFTPVQKPITPEELFFTPWLSTRHGNGLKMLDHSLASLNQMAQLVRDEPLRLDLPQRRLIQQRFLNGNGRSVSDWQQEALGVSDSTAVDLMMGAFIQTLSPLGLTQKGKRLKQIFSLLCAEPSLEPIEALLKMQRLLLSQIAKCLGDRAFYLSEGFNREQLLERYTKALHQRDKALKKWCACRDGAAAGSRRDHT